LKLSDNDNDDDYQRDVHVVQLYLMTTILSDGTAVSLMLE